jgi:hypothetical protein
MQLVACVRTSKSVVFSLGCRELKDEEGKEGKVVEDNHPLDPCFPLWRTRNNVSA